MTIEYAPGLPTRYREARTAARLTQEQLADLTQLGVRTIKAAEAGENPPTRAHLAAVALATGCTFAWLAFDRSADPDDPSEQANARGRCTARLSRDDRIPHPDDLRQVA